MWQAKTIYYFFVSSGKFSEIGAGPEKAQFGFGYGHKIMMEVWFYK